MAIWGFIRLDASNGSSIGNSRAAVLEGLERYKSLTLTAEAMDLSFQRCQSAAQEMNKAFGDVIKTKRGRYEGGAYLTVRGEQLLALYRSIESKLYLTCASELKRIEELAGEDPDALRIVPHWARLQDPDGWKKKQR